MLAALPVQEVARRSVSKTQVEVENGEEEEDVAQMVRIEHVTV